MMTRTSRRHRSTEYGSQGCSRDLAGVVDRYFAEEVVIAIPSAPGDVLRQ